MSDDPARSSYLDQVGERVKSTVGWKDLTLAEPQHEVLRGIVSRMNFKESVKASIGNTAKALLDAGVAVLFVGPNGRAKTTAATVLANELNLALYRIDLTRVVSQYVGETEKNLNRLFDQAGAAGAILFFDEADALFDRRSEVKDSHDRYANLEINYLLQRLETYRGLAIFSVNRLKSLDEAFTRRFHCVLEFARPAPES